MMDLSVIFSNCELLRFLNIMRVYKLTREGAPEVPSLITLQALLAQVWCVWSQRAENHGLHTVYTMSVNTGLKDKATLRERSLCPKLLPP